MSFDFHYTFIWETSRTKRIQGGWKASFLLQNRCRKAELWDWKTRKTFFGLLVMPVVLYGCEVWGRSMSNYRWRQLERIQKHMITCNLKLKTTVPYEIILAESGTFPLEASTISRLLNYLKKVENMDSHRWPKAVVKEVLGCRKKTWMKQNNNWLSKWDINLHDFHNTNEEIKKYVTKKFLAAMWTKQIGRKKDHYVKAFNPTWEHGDKNYLGAAIKGKAWLLIAQLRTGSHHLRCETGRWTIPKEVWEDRICMFCSKGVVETEWHFVMECMTYEDIHSQYEGNLKINNLHELFDEEKIIKTTRFLIKIHSRRSSIEKILETP